MRKKYIFGKKLYISILTTILILLTTVATTFAWIGVFAKSTFETFSISIKSSSLEEYGIEISSTGKEGTFSDTISTQDIKRQILSNWNYKNINTYSDSEVDYLFSNLNMHQCTNLPVISGGKVVKLGKFKTIEGNDTFHYFKFDIYVASTQYYEGESVSDYLLDVYIGPNLVSGKEKTVILDDEIVFPSTFSNPLSTLPSHMIPLTGGDSLERVTISSESACRVAFEKYKVVERYDTDAYLGENPVSTIIYSSDSYDYPTLNSNTGVYNFGGILPNESNFSILNYNLLDYRYQKNGIRSVSLPSDIYQARGVGSSTADKILSSSTNHLIDSSDSNEKVSLNQMMKVTVYFWFEGWDADCFNALNESPVSLSISLNIANEDEF